MGGDESDKEKDLAGGKGNVIIMQAKSQIHSSLSSSSERDQHRLEQGCKRVVAPTVQASDSLVHSGGIWVCSPLLGGGTQRRWLDILNSKWCEGQSADNSI